MNKPNLLFKRILIYCTGLLILAFGVSISILSDLGVSPVNSVPYVVSNIINVELGTCVTIFLSIFLVLQILILRKEFKFIEILQIFCSFLFGIFVDFTNSLVKSHIPAPENYFHSLILLIISIFLVALGVLLYLKANLILLPCEGIIKVISEKKSYRFATVKMIFDIFVVTLAIVLSLVFLNKLEGVREGTIIAAFGVGLAMKLIEKIINKLSFLKI